MTTLCIDGGRKDKIRPGDILLSVNNRPVGDTTTMLNLIAALAPGQQATIKLSRNQAESEVTVTIGRRPPPRQRK